MRLYGKASALIKLWIAEPDWNEVKLLRSASEFEANCRVTPRDVMTAMGQWQQEDQISAAAIENGGWCRIQVTESTTIVKIRQKTDQALKVVCLEQSPNQATQLLRLEVLR